MLKYVNNIICEALYVISNAINVIHNFITIIYNYKMLHTYYYKIPLRYNIVI